jgi:hypothetical protein
LAPVSSCNWAGFGMAELSGLDQWQAVRGPFQRRDFDAKSFTLALVLTALLFALLASLGADDHDPAETDDFLAVFDIPPVQDEVPLSPDVPEQQREELVEQDVASPPPPAPAPAAAGGAPDLPIVPIPQIPLSPVVVPEVAVSRNAPVLAEGSGDQIAGDGDAAGVGTGGQGAGGSGTGVDGAGGGKGARTRLRGQWAPEMRLSQLNAFFPATALESGRGGYALIKCFALPGHRVRDCSVVSEYPAGLGFGAAAVASQPVLRVQVRDQRGKPVYNTWFLYHAHFRHPVTKRRAPQR